MCAHSEKQYSRTSGMSSVLNLLRSSFIRSMAAWSSPLPTFQSLSAVTNLLW